ncbi:MAG TPA: hypothetical protein VFD90_16130 [Gaiellales bacterium]|nr:hypothetical protein [Gaiellales bacterium]
MEYLTASAAAIAEGIAQELARPVTSAAVTTGGAARAAALIAPLLSQH